MPEPKNIEQNVERRFWGNGTLALKRDVEIETDLNVIEGTACVFNQAYDLGWFTEEIREGAFEGCDMSEVVALLNHDPNYPLARNSAGTLTLEITDVGLIYRFTAPDSPNGENVKVAIQRGDIKASSWAFSVSDQEWEMKDGKDHRVITKIKVLYDVSPVTYPANPDTSVALRSKPIQKEDIQVQETRNDDLDQMVYDHLEAMYTAHVI